MSVTLDRVSASSSPSRPRRDFASLPEVLPLPDLIQTQLDSFQWFCDEGLQELGTLGVGQQREGRRAGRGREDRRHRPEAPALPRESAA